MWIFVSSKFFKGINRVLQLILVLGSVLACLLFYLSNKQQAVLNQALPKRPWRFFAYGLSLSCLIGWLSLFTLSSAIFTWLALFMLLIGLVPFLSLILSRK
ncbi:hypothetical protein L2744_06465 [Shewanella profunda]|uniref:hypothetical protein n=1 Tax=Shewanella profunda TaxID=254793 RepID=UPI002010B049|nr:hypothetical protein [Shewanella profunda]MCL1089258.1 hypothetical protein [Shewanella profunda]